MSLIPPDTVSCPRCAGQIAMLESLEDTVDTQVSRWACADCCAGGWIGLTIHLTASTVQTAPRHIIERRHIDHSVARRIA